MGLGPGAEGKDVLRFVFDLDIPLVQGRVPFHRCLGRARAGREGGLGGGRRRQPRPQARFVPGPHLPPRLTRPLPAPSPAPLCLRPAAAP
jgi:hypothetical protein